MWEWLLRELNNACKIVGVSKCSGAEADDVVSDVLMQLISNPEYVNEIYSRKKKGLLVRLVKAQIYDSTSKSMKFDNKMELSRYQKIIAVCEEYGIEPVPQNAYKISGIMNSKTYGISMIATLLSKKLFRYKTVSTEYLKMIESAEIYKCGEMDYYDNDNRFLAQNYGSICER